MTYVAGILRTLFTKVFDREPCRRLRIAVIDDSSTFVDVICALLGRDDNLDVIARGYDGTEAIEIVAKLHPALV